MAVAVDTGPEFNFKTPVLLFQDRYQRSRQPPSYDVGLDGRFLFIKPSNATPPAHYGDFQLDSDSGQLEVTNQSVVLRFAGCRQCRTHRVSRPRAHADDADRTSLGHRRACQRARTTRWRADCLRRGYGRCCSKSRKRARPAAGRPISSSNGIVTVSSSLRSSISGASSKSIGTCWQQPPLLNRSSCLPWPRWASAPSWGTRARTRCSRRCAAPKSYPIRPTSWRSNVRAGCAATRRRRCVWSTSHRCVRAQEIPKRRGLTAHFRIFCLVSAGLERQNHAFVVDGVAEHITTMLHGLDQLEQHGFAFPDRRITVLATEERAALGDRIVAALGGRAVDASPSRASVLQQRAAVSEWLRVRPTASRFRSSTAAHSTGWRSSRPIAGPSTLRAVWDRSSCRCCFDGRSPRSAGLQACPRAQKPRPEGLGYERRALSTQVNSGVGGVEEPIQRAERSPDRFVSRGQPGCSMRASRPAPAPHPRWNR